MEKISQKLKNHTIKNVKDTVWKKFRVKALKEGKTLAQLLEKLLTNQ